MSAIELKHAMSDTIKFSIDDKRRIGNLLEKFMFVTQKNLQPFVDLCVTFINAGAKFVGDNLYKILEKIGVESSIAKKIGGTTSKLFTLILGTMMQALTKIFLNPGWWKATHSICKKCWDDSDDYISAAYSYSKKFIGCVIQSAIIIVETLLEQADIKLTQDEKQQLRKACDEGLDDDIMNGFARQLSQIKLKST